MKSFFCFVVVMIFTGQTYGQSVVINEMSQGSAGNKEWVELLVVESNVDMRGWTLGDNDDGTWDNLLIFANVPAWQNVRAGTLIVIYNQNDIDGTVSAAGGENTDFSDFEVMIESTNAAFFSGGYASFAQFGNGDFDDAAALRNASGVVIHDMVVTHPVATVTAPDAGQAKYFAGNAVAATMNDANWTNVASSAATPGQPNGGANTIWINWLRMPPVAVPISLWSNVLSVILILFFSFVGHKKYRKATKNV